MNLARKIYHPATMTLLRHQFRAKLNNITRAFSNPRRKILAGVAVILGCVWLSQAVASVMFRQSADPESLRFWLPLGLFAYSSWHIVKITMRKPVEPFEWTPAEQEFVCSAPITRTHLISYRMASIISSAMIKAVCFSIVMIPDLSVWVLGLIGMFAGLLFVDLIRVSFELLFHGLTRICQNAVRALVVTALVGCCATALVLSLSAPDAANNIASPGSLIFFQQFVGEIIGLTSTSVGALFLLPFRPFGEFILGDSISLATMGYAGLSVALVMVMGGMVYRLDRWVNVQTLRKEKLAFEQGLVRYQKGQGRSAKTDRNVSVPWRLGGFGSLAWRQLRGAYHYRMTVLFSIGIPTALCCIPLMADHNPLLMLMNIVAGLVFYSFLLLPSALILDFRRDVDRFAVLKSLPISPLATTLGQLTAPVLICSLFQWVVLTIAVVSGSVIYWQALIAAILLLPLNTLIFAIENFTFLLAPYRRNREGIDVFLRTILTFTAKGILFAVGLVGVLAWAYAAKSICQMIGVPAATGALFGVGAWSMACMAAAGFVFGTVWLFARFDPSNDSPAIS